MLPDPHPALQRAWDKCNGYGLVFGGHQPGELIAQWCVWAEMSLQGSEPIVSLHAKAPISFLVLDNKLVGTGHDASSA